jgi:hypothetical protein
VHGIVFKIPSYEIEALRRYEGVDKQFFVEQRLVVELEAISDPGLSRQKSVDVVEVLAKKNSDHGQHDFSATMRPTSSNEICQVENRLSGTFTSKKWDLIDVTPIIGISNFLHAAVQTLLFPFHDHL